ncbi:MAG: hypothetical protein KDA76_09320 [Planctomycetaceae bacterium]|nr:hypothetical protein [Planctomycetaceae bacterium]
MCQANLFRVPSHLVSHSGRYSIVSALILLILVGLPGCDKQAEIHSYRTEKPDQVRAKNQVEPAASNAPAKEAPAMASPAKPAEPVRMLAAIVPQPEQTWFYKLTGPVAAVQSQAEVLAGFITQVEYKDGRPAWSLPEGWEQREGNQFRFATLIIPSAEGPLEMSVSGLPTSGDEVTQAVDNINRWRGQVGLGPIASADLTGATDDLSSETSVRVVAGDRRIYFVNLVGTQQETGMRPPFAR